MEGRSPCMGTLGVHASVDLGAMHHRAARRSYWASVTHLSHKKWFVTLCGKLMKDLRKVNHCDPLDLMKFLSVLKHFFMLGWELDDRIFYVIIEHTIRLVAVMVWYVVFL